MVVAKGREALQAAFEELRHEFGEQERELGTVVVKGGKTPLVEHVHVLGLPLLGKTHASLGNGLIHVAAVLGLRLPDSDGPDGGGAAELVEGGAAAEAYRCCQIMEQVLKSCSAGWGNLVRLTVHVPDLTTSKLEDIEQVIDQFYGEKDCPAITKTAVGCSSLRLAASVQMEGTALLPTDMAKAMPPPPGLERMPDSPPLVCQPDPGLKRQLSETLEELEGCSSEPLVAQKRQGAWLVVDTGSEQDAPDARGASEPAQEPSPGSTPPRSTAPQEEACLEAAAADQEARCLGLVGQVQSVSIVELQQREARKRKLQFQGQHNAFREVEMLMSKAYRTIRLDPGVIRCQRDPSADGGAFNMPWPAVWNFTFDVAVVRSTNCFVNIGLVEWVAKAAAPSSSDIGPDPTLGELVGATSSEGKEMWQHTSESPRQIMIGCRKGVKWYGDGYWENLFKDDICEGSVLQFYCDFAMDVRGAIQRMRLWLLPSSVMFRKRGWQCVRLARPICEWTPPPSAPDRRSYTCSLWVPAVTLFSQEDAVVVSWRGGGDGRP